MYCLSILFNLGVRLCSFHESFTEFILMVFFIVSVVFTLIFLLYFQVKITPVVKYDWEPIFYVGNLVAIHWNNIYAAYTLRGMLYEYSRTCIKRLPFRQIKSGLIQQVTS